MKDVIEKVVLCVFSDKDMLNRYYIAVVSVFKNIETNKILKVKVSQKDYKRKMHTEVSEILRNIKKSLNSSGKTQFVVISDLEDFSQDSLLTPIYNIKNEHNLIRGYVSVFNNVKFGAFMKGSPQNINNNAGIILDDTKNTTKFRIDYESIEMITIAIMHAIQVVKDNQADKMFEFFNEIEDCFEEY